MKVTKEKVPGRYGDGGGLYLLVRSPHAKFWLFRYTMPGGKLREMGLGKVDSDGRKGGVSLAEARDRASDLRRMVTSGIDPLRHREEQDAAAAASVQAAAQAKTFDEVVSLYLEAHEGSWRNAKHGAQWAMTLREYAGPHLGPLIVGEIETVHVAATLRSLWYEKPETAGRLRGRIEAVLDYAAVHGWRNGPNPARWRGHLDKVFPRRARLRPVKHHAAMPWQDVPAFMATLRNLDAVAARALEFVILTAARSGEVLGATWSEIDLDGAVWTIPGERMKAGKEHRVPLAPAAVALLRKMLPLRRTGSAATLVFPGRCEGRPLSNMAMAMSLRRIGRDRLTVHGFRSTFRDWAGETTAHPREVVEAALAHRLGGKVEQAYARGDLFAKRRRLMEHWAAYCAEQHLKSDGSEPAMPAS
jgi:integrase